MFTNIFWRPSIFEIPFETIRCKWRLSCPDPLTSIFQIKRQKLWKKYKKFYFIYKKKNNDITYQTELVFDESV